MENLIGSLHIKILIYRQKDLTTLYNRIRLYWVLCITAESGHNHTRFPAGKSLSWKEIQQHVSSLNLANMPNLCKYILSEEYIKSFMCLTYSKDVLKLETLFQGFPKIKAQKLMDSNKMLFLKVLHGHTLCWKGIAYFRSQLLRFEKNSSLYHSKLDNLASIDFILQRK